MKTDAADSQARGRGPRCTRDGSAAGASRPIPSRARHRTAARRQVCRPNSWAQNGRHYPATASGASDSPAPTTSTLAAARQTPRTQRVARLQRRACASRASSSLRAARRKASERAEGNAETGNGWRKRTSHKPSGRTPACRSKAPCTWRFNRLRVTARRACRLGTTQPIQCAVGKSSTSGGQLGARAVDNSMESNAMACFRAAGTGTLGVVGR